MQIEIYNPSQGSPLPPIQWNYEEVKKWVQNGLEDYKGRVYTDSTIAEAKKDRANLNKLADAIDTKRKEMKTLYLEPYAEFEAQAKELTAMIKDTMGEIDAQIKGFETFRKEEKQKQIIAIYEDMIGDLADLVPYERLHNPRWLNVTTSMQTVTNDMGKMLCKITVGLAAINKVEMDADVAAQVKDVFLRNYDLAEALAEKERIEQRREAMARYEAEKKATKPEPVPAAKVTPPEPEKPTGAKNSAPVVENTGASEQLIELVFCVWVNRRQMEALRGFLKTNGIKYGRVVPKE